MTTQWGFRVMTTLTDLDACVRAFHERFFGDDPPAFDARFRVMGEEYGEVVMAVQELLIADALGVRGPEYAKLVAAAGEEIGDLLFTLLGLLHYFGADADTVLAGMAAVIKKNAAKTQDTHVLNGKRKVVRRE